MNEKVSASMEALTFLRFHCYFRCVFSKNIMRILTYNSLSAVGEFYVDGYIL